MMMPAPMPLPTLIDDHAPVGRMPPERPLGERGRLRVIGDVDRQARPLTQPGAQMELVPIEVDRPTDRARGGVDESRGPDPDAQGWLPRRPNQPVDHLVQPDERLVAVPAVQRQSLPMADVSREVDHRTPDLALTHMHPDQLPGVARVSGAGWAPCRRWTGRARSPAPAPPQRAGSRHPTRWSG